MQNPQEQFYTYETNMVKIKFIKDELLDPVQITFKHPQAYEMFQQYVDSLQHESRQDAREMLIASSDKDNLTVHFLKNNFPCEYAPFHYLLGKFFLETGFDWPKEYIDHYKTDYIERFKMVQHKNGLGSTQFNGLYNEPYFVKGSGNFALADIRFDKVSIPVEMVKMLQEAGEKLLAEGVMAVFKHCESVADVPVVANQPKTVPQLPPRKEKPDFEITKTKSFVFVVFSDKEQAKVFLAKHDKNIHALWDSTLQEHLPKLDSLRIEGKCVVRIPIEFKLGHNKPSYTYAQFCKDEQLNFPNLDQIQPETRGLDPIVNFKNALNNVVEKYTHSHSMFSRKSTESQIFIHDLNNLVSKHPDDLKAQAQTLMKNYVLARYQSQNFKNDEIINLLLEHHLINQKDLKNITHEAFVNSCAF